MNIQEIEKNHKFKNPLLQKIRHKQTILINNEVNYNQEQLFVDYINLNPNLYENLGIDNSTIEFINSEFMLYYVYTENFYFIFRNELKKHYKYYKDILKMEMREELFNISTNIIFRNLANERINTSFTNSANKQDIQNNKNSTSRKDSSGSESNTEKNLIRALPMSQVGTGTFDSMFSYNSATQTNENRNFADNENITKDTSSTTNKTNSTNNTDVYDLAKQFDTSNENNKELNQQAVKSIDNIIGFLWQSNKSKDYLIEKLKPCFVNVY